MIAKVRSITPYIPSWMIDSGFTHHQLAIVTYIACRGKCFESKKSIWTKLKMGEKTYRRTIQELTDAGWLKQSWINRKRCLEITYTGNHMDILKFEKQSNDCIKERSNDCIKEQSNDCTNIPREPIKLINQVPVQGHTCTSNGTEGNEEVGMNKVLAFMIEGKRAMTKKLPKATQLEREGGLHVRL
jgi:hypothetical protein